MSPIVGLPPAQGLYDPANEHDACGVGFIAHIKGRKSHAIVRRGAEILCRLTHRGAVGADPKDGDGAGIMIQIPDAYYRAVADCTLPKAGEYATAIVFLPKDASLRGACESAFDEAMTKTGLKSLGWRDVRTDASTIGRDARSNEPCVRQVFVGRGAVSTKRLELMCYLARRRAENTVIAGNLNGGQYFYVNSLSSKRVLYKGMLLSDQLLTYYPELADERVISSVALVHQRYSTNTFPTWDLAHPFRFLCHNGEINTLRGNVNWMRARQAIFAHSELGKAVTDLAPVILREDGSDTACLDNAVDLLVSCGYSLEHALAMLVPEAWQNDEFMDRKVRNFFRYHACLTEPWDGPANLAAFDGERIVAALDRNGLRPVRYWITADNEIIYASEAGVLDVPPSKVVAKGRLAPGKMLCVDTVKGTITFNDEIKRELAAKADYRGWLEDGLIEWKDIPRPAHAPMAKHEDLRQLQQTFGYSVEDLRVLLAPMCKTGKEPVGSMGIDTPLAVLSNKSKLLFWYFKQQFAQVTNPPIDPIREEVVMSLNQYIGSHRNILQPGPENCRLVELEHPILSNSQLEQLRLVDIPGLKGCTLDLTWPAASGGVGLEARLQELCTEAEARIADGCNVLVLSDRDVHADRVPIPNLLGLAAIHHHLIRAGSRMRCSLVIESGEAREVHHAALLLGYGAEAINPYLAYDTIEDMVDHGDLPLLDSQGGDEITKDSVNHYIDNYVHAIQKGLLKVFSKMGISTLQSYCGAQIFECVGLEQSVVQRYFAGTASRIGGASLEVIAQETRMRHRVAFAPLVDGNRDLDFGGEYHWRRDGEEHIENPEMVSLLQQAARTGDRAVFKRFCQKVDQQAGRLKTLRGLFKFKPTSAIPLDQVEPVEAITKRFCTGAMSLGSISPEAHETLAIAMNRLGGRSNTGEGGEDARRFVKDANGDLRRSFIKQVASARFGVTPHYLANAGEMQIKIAQGAKPGEGGQLPGHKVTEYIAMLRHSVPLVGLISPPPHHDIYSIEDLKQLIFDLKNCNPEAEVSVKLVSIVGVGTVAAGVAKGHSDRVVIAGYDGGTGASPLSSIKHAGAPWEIGLAETQQTLVLNDLRGRIYVQTDGQIRTPRDVLVATLLGAEEYGIATGALIAAGCIMMRKCHLDTCPVGVATQNQELRDKFTGKPAHVVNFFTMLAEGIREQLAALGARSIDDLVGRAHDLLEMDTAITHWKSKGLDFSRILAKPQVGPQVAIRRVQDQKHGVDQVLDRELISLAEPALAKKKKVVIERPIKNHHRSVATMLSGQVARLHGVAGLPAGTITLRFRGVAGQSFGCFLAPGIDLSLEGEANDYVGKGQAGGRIAIRPDRESTLDWSDNSIVGNTVLYGATGGRFFAAGQAGERFCVRNSGVTAVIEGVGDHGCEYMTGGLVVVLGPTGRNFAAGMSGGFAFVLDEDKRFANRCNHEMVELETVEEPEDIARVKALIEEHAACTGSPKARAILEQWERYLTRFVKVFPHEYRRALSDQASRQEQASQREPVAASAAGAAKEPVHG